MDTEMDADIDAEMDADVDSNDAISHELAPSNETVDLHKAEVDAKAAAVKAETEAVNAIERAIVARQAAFSSKEALEKARMDSQNAAAKAKQVVEIFDRLAQTYEQRVKEVEDAQQAVKDAAVTREQAHLTAKNAKEGMATAAAAVAAAEKELKEAGVIRTNTEKEARTLAEKAKSEATEVKWAKREADKASTAASAAATAENSAYLAISDHEQNVEDANESASALRTVSYELKDQEEEAQQAVDAAARAAAEYVDEGGAWAERTAKTLKERENAYEKIKKQYDKAKKNEIEAENQADTAQKRLEDAIQDHAEKKKKTAEAEQTLQELTEAWEHQSKLAEDAEEKAKEAEEKAQEAEDEYQAASKKLETTKSAASDTYVEMTAQAARDAEANEVKANDAEAKAIAAVAEAKEQMKRAQSEKEAAVQQADVKRVVAEKAAEKENDADAKAAVANDLVARAEKKALTLAMAKYAVKGVVFMPLEEAEANAVDARSQRRTAAAKDIRMVAIGKAPADLTAADKWYLFYQSILPENKGADVMSWNVRRLLYGIDGSFKSNVDIYMADYVGSALDRRQAPALAQYCKIQGEGLTQAVLGQVATFTIESCSPQGIRFDDGGDHFFVHIRSAGLGTRIRAKIVDHDDGHYTVTYKPNISGRCSISVSLLGDPLPGSPYSCLISASIPDASHCMVARRETETGPLLPLDPEWTVVTHKPEQFLVSFKDIYGNITAATELDVYAQRADLFMEPSPRSNRIHSPRSARMRSPRTLSPRAGRGLTETRSPPQSTHVAQRNVPMAVSSWQPANDPGGASSTKQHLRLELSSRLHQSDLPGAELIRGMDSFEDLIVGSKPLVVTASKAVHSQRIGHLQPGLVLKLIRIEIVRPEDGSGDEGVLRACVLLDDMTGQESWRGVYPSEQDWRTLSWREQSEDLVEAVQEARLDAMRRKQEQKKKESSRESFAPKLKLGQVGGARDSAASSNRPSYRSSQRMLSSRGEKRASVKKGKKSAGDCSPVDEESRRSGEAPQGAPMALDPIAESSKEEPLVLVTPVKAPAAAPAPVPVQEKKSTEEKKKKTRGNQGGSKDVAAKKKAAAEAALAEKLAAEKALLDKEAAEQAERDAARAALSATKIESHYRRLQSQHKADAIREERRQAELAAMAEAAKAEADRQEQKADAALSRALVRAARTQSPSKAPAGVKLKIGKGIKQAPNFGWVTISTSDDGDQPVTKQMGMLPAHVRREQMAQWQRRYAIDSARERERARLRDEEVDAMREELLRAKRPVKAGEAEADKDSSKAQFAKGKEETRPVSPGSPPKARTDEPSPTGGSKKVPVETAVVPQFGIGWNLLAPSRLPRAAYLEELEADPKGIGFAYGGMTPGRLARGKPVEAHAVHFSIGGCGKYLLHVGLRQTSTPLPGSPFPLTVLPGVPHPLSTMIPSSDLPIRGFIQTDKSGGVTDIIVSMGEQVRSFIGGVMGAEPDVPERGGESCLLKLLSRDKMGNVCAEGGAQITCGVVGRDDTAAICTDKGNGIYLIKWWMREPGTYELYVKMDGLHILGSPCLAHIFENKDALDADAERRRRRGGVGKREDAEAAAAAAAARAAAEAEAAAAAERAAAEAEALAAAAAAKAKADAEMAEYRRKVQEAKSENDAKRAKMAAIKADEDARAKARKEQGDKTKKGKSDGKGKSKANKES